MCAAFRVGLKVVNNHTHKKEKRERGPKGLDSVRVVRVLISPRVLCVFLFRPAYCAYSYFAPHIVRILISPLLL